MTLCEEPFDDQSKLTRDWSLAPGMAVRNGVLSFAPNRNEGYCVGVTRQDDFRDFSVVTDARIVSRAVGVVLRATAPDQYYMVQFDIANEPSVVWFHTFTPAAKNGYRLELVPSALAPKVGVWSRMRVVANNNAFDVFLGEPGRPLRHCASWQDRLRTFRQGAVGVWEHGGEAGEYRSLRVEALTHEDA
jgi:hypothetical protein